MKQRPALFANPCHRSFLSWAKNGNLIGGREMLSASLYADTERDDFSESTRHCFLRLFCGKCLIFSGGHSQIRARFLRSGLRLRLPAQPLTHAVRHVNAGLGSLILVLPGQQRGQARAAAAGITAAAAAAVAVVAAAVAAVAVAGGDAALGAGQVLLGPRLQVRNK